jgi:anti-sigma factor RsiW
VSSRPQDPGCEWQLDCAPYVLGALEEHEAQIHGAHLAECPLCRADVTELQIVADVLALGVPRTAAPLRLRGRIMGSAHAEAGPRGAPGREASRAASARAPGREAGRAASARAPGREAGRAASARAPRTRRLLPGLAGALALSAGLLIGALVFSSGSSEQTEVVRAIVVDPGHHATAELRKAGSHIELVVVGMPAPPPGRIYEVWLEHGTEAPEATDALFSVTKTGSGTVGVPDDLRGVSKVLVTSEPLGGSLKPTRTPVIVGSI